MHDKVHSFLSFPSLQWSKVCIAHLLIPSPFLSLGVSPFGLVLIWGGPGSAAPPNFTFLKNGSSQPASLLHLWSLMWGLHRTSSPTSTRHRSPACHAQLWASATSRLSPYQNFPQLPAPVPPDLQLCPLQGTLGQTWWAHLQGMYALRITMTSLVISIIYLWPNQIPALCFLTALPVLGYLTAAPGIPQQYQSV